MTPRILFSESAERWPAWEAALTAAFEQRGLTAEITLSADDPASIDYIIYSPGSDLQDFAPFTRLTAVFSLWAGVEKVAPNPTITVPLTRMVDPGLTQGMVEYVTTHTLRHHMGLDAHIRGQNGLWTENPAPPLAQTRKVTILGFGALGQACGAVLAGLGFDVHGWARSAKTCAGITTHAGPEGLQPALSGADIVILLLPRTPQTETILSAPELAMLAPGAAIINAGRGELIDDDALLAALDSGHLGHATLDVFRIEPLPADHRFWSHDRVTVTPHIAAETRPQTAAGVVAENLARSLAGQALLHLVDRDAGY